MSEKFFFTSPPSLRKFFILKKLALTFFLLNIFLGDFVFASEKDDLSIFLENLMIREGGIYTLLGSKPVTEFDITSTSDETEEEIARSYEELKLFSAKKKLEQIPDFELFKSKYLKNRDALKFLNKKKLWEAWVKAIEPFSNPAFKLVPREGDFTVGLFINVPQALYVLKKHYEAFSHITRTQFDVSTVLDSIEDISSVFWKRVFDSHYLHGLLLGYGEKNSFLFDWARNEKLPINSVSMLRFPELSRINQHVKNISKKRIEIHDLPLPYFVSFEINDEMVERYTKEREKIIHLLQDKDLVTFVLDCLNTHVQKE